LFEKSSVLMFSLNYVLCEIFVSAQDSTTGRSNKIKGYLFACWRVYDILRTFVRGPKHPLANKLFDMFGVNHGVERLWPIPWHVA
jgi:hypothetical protein